MTDRSPAPVSLSEAEAFARRHGLDWIEGAHIEALSAAMTAAARAGRMVPRVSSKQDQPAQIFSVPGSPTR